MIDYKTYDEQLEIIKNRGLIVEDEERVKKVLRSTNYYNIVNRYKEIFVNNNGSLAERFKENTTFNHLYGLYEFDKSLSNLFLKYILNIENTLKSIIAHEFAKSYAVNENITNYENYADLLSAVKNENFNNGCYLNIDNFDTNKVIRIFKDNREISVNDLLNDFKRVLKDECIHKNKMINHYLKHYQVVPLWVFVNCLTLGQVGKFFYFLKNKEQSAVCKNLSQLIDNDIRPNDMQAYLTLLNAVRNLCAHNSRFYDFRHYFTISTKNKIFLSLDIPSQPKGVLALLVTLANLLDGEDFTNLFVAFLKVLQDFLAIKAIEPNLLFSKMGLKGNWLYLYLAKGSN